MRGPGRTTRLVLTLAALGATVAVLHRLGRGPLAAPPAGSLAAARAWLDDRTSVEAGAALARLAGLALGWYLLVATALHGVARALRWQALESATAALVGRGARRLLGASAALSVASMATLAAVAPPPTAAAIPAANPAPLPAPAPDELLRRLPDEGAAPVATVGTATMRLLDVDRAAPVEPTPEPAPGPSPEPEPPAAPAPAPAPAPTPTAAPDDRWEVTRGESFWSIAAERVADELGAEGDDGAVAAYWARLVEANRDRLVDPTNADLLFTGQVLDLPPV